MICNDFLLLPRAVPRQIFYLVLKVALLLCVFIYIYTHIYFNEHTYEATPGFLFGCLVGFSFGGFFACVCVWGWFVVVVGVFFTQNL